MGLGLSLFAQPKRNLLFKSAFSLEKVARWTRKNLPIQGPMTTLYEQYEHGDHLICRPTPLEEDVQFSIENGLLKVSAKTSSLGPGYHACLADSLRQIANQNGFEWQEDEEDFDETGYFSTGDFGKLQHEYDKLGLKLAALVLRNAGSDYTAFRLALPADYNVEGFDSFALTSLGPRSKSFFEGFVSENYYIWWDQDLSPKARQNFAESLLWCQFSWATPLADHDEMLARVALDLTEDVELPWQDEVLGLMHVDETREPKQDGIGYRKRDFRRRGTGPWTLLIPGYYENEVEEHNTIWFWGTRSVYFSSLSFERSGNKPNAHRTDPDAEIAEEIDGLYYQAKFTTSTNDDSEYMNLSGTVEADEDIAILTVTFQDASDRDWAIDVFKSIRLIKPAADGS